MSEINNKELKNESFPERLKTLRLEKRLSQSQIASKIGIHKINYGRYERGESKPSTEFLLKLADVMGVSTDYLLEGKEEDAAVANMKDKELLRMFEKIEKFSPKNKEAIKIVIDALITKESIQELSHSLN